MQLKALESKEVFKRTDLVLQDFFTYFFFFLWMFYDLISVF